MPTIQYYPPVSDLVDTTAIPGNLQVLENTLQQGVDLLLGKIFYKDLAVEVLNSGDLKYYNLTLLTKSLQLPLPAGMSLVFFRGEDTNLAEFPVICEWQWPLYKYIPEFETQGFAYTPEAFIDILIELAEIRDRQEFFTQIVAVFLDDGNAAYLDFFNNISSHLNKYNNGVNAVSNEITAIQNNLALIRDELDTQLTTTNLFTLQYLYENYSTNAVFSPAVDAIEQSLDTLRSLGLQVNLYQDVLINLFLGLTDLDDKFQRLLRLFNYWMQDIDQEDIKSFLIPQFSFELNNINLGLEFPRNWLVPVYTGSEPVAGLNINDPLPEPYRSALEFNVGSLKYSTARGFAFDQQSTFTFKRSMIGKTGLLVEFDGLKVDMSDTYNITEAQEDGRPDDFIGIYAETASITLPSKWFKQVDNTTAQIAGRNLLVGTGGISGTIGLEAVGGSANPVLTTRLGTNNGFELGFKSFSLTFQKNTITASDIAGQLKIPRLKDASGNDALIEVQGHLDTDGDFLLTASEKDGLKEFNLFEVLSLNITTLELGREKDKFFIGISGKIKFTKPVMNKILKGQAIEFSRMRIYSDGSLEIEGGTLPVPGDFTLDLGPLEIGISGINFGSYQQDYMGQRRKYYAFGFDGALGLGPLGFEARGKGMQYYFTVDNDAGKPAHDYFSIQTIEVDLTIPGNATPESATAIIQGYLSIPRPGESPEYEGGVSLKLPKAKISGSAAMRLQPQHPAFLLDASIDLPKPIPLGATGLGIYGFRGLLGYRYLAEKEAVGLTSGQDTWYDYYKYPPRGIHISKFSGPDQTKNARNPISLGAGATIATLDDGILLSTRVMLLLSIPSLFILEGKANILSKRLGLDDSSEPPFFAFLAYGDNSIEAGLGADYKLPKSNGNIIDLYAEVQAAFFFNNPSAWYVNFGTKEKPISARLLSLLQTQTYLMLSAKGIELGARAEFNFNKKFGPAHVKAWLYVETGARLSFERPQLGGYIAAGGGLEVRLWFISVGLSFDAILAAEAAQPFLIFAQFRVCGKIKIAFIKIKKCVNVELKWEKNKQVNRTPIAPLLPARTDELVKGVHMLTGETFDLAKLSQAPTSGSINGGFIPLDTYIDIKFTKAVLPNAVAQQIGGMNNPPTHYSDLIPPQKTVKGGKEVRQVKHRYSIESIALKMWNGSTWVAYHPYKAITNHAHPATDFSHLKIGHWQKSDQQYNALRLLASHPFSYTEQGEPGWFTPEQVGITAATLFCEGIKRDQGMINWLQKPLATRYTTNSTNYYYHQRLYFKLTGSSFVDVQGQTWGAYGQVAQDTATPGFAQSLQFDNSNHLEIKLPEAAHEIRLNLSIEAQGVTIQYYQALQNDANTEVTYHLVNETHKTKAALVSEVSYNAPAQGIDLVVVIPDKIDQNAVNVVREKLGKLYLDAYFKAVNAGTPLALDTPDFVLAHNALIAQLASLYTVGGRALTDNTSPEVPDLFLSQYSKSTHTYHDQAETSQGEIYAVGQVLHSSGNKQLGLITKLTAQGDIIWEKSYEAPNGHHLVFHQVVICDNDDVMVSVHHDNQLSPSVSLGLLRIQSNGTLRWYQAAFYGTISSIDQPSLLEKMSNDRYLLTGDHVAYEIQGANLKMRSLTGAYPIKGMAVGSGSFLFTGQESRGAGFLYKSSENFNQEDSKFWYAPNGGNVQIEASTYSQGYFFIAGILEVDKNIFPPPAYRLAHFIAKIDASTPFPATLVVKAFTETNDASFNSLEMVANANEVLVSIDNQVYKFDHQLHVQGHYVFEAPDQAIHLDQATSERVLLHHQGENQYLARLSLQLESCRSQSSNTVVEKNITLTANLPRGPYSFFPFEQDPNSLENILSTDISSTITPICPFASPQPLPTFSFKSYLHEVKWQSVEDYVLNQHIPAQPAIQADYQASVDAINKTVTPVWRPNTQYYIHFKLKDTVDDGGNQKVFDYYYGFQTAGPIGHFHNATGGYLWRRTRQPRAINQS